MSVRVFVGCLAACFLFVFGVATAGAQQYTTPTTPQYTPPTDQGAAPDEGAGDTPEAPADEAPDNAGAAPGAGDQTPRPLSARESATLPLTGGEEVVFLSALGFVLLLGGFAVRRGLRSATLT